MNLERNNAEKLATTLIIFFILFLTYVLVCIIFKTMTGTNLESMVKDGMSFAVMGITPVVAILLFSDWREQHKLMKNEANIEKILLDLNNLDRKIKRILNVSLSLRADAIVIENLIPLKPEIDQCSQDINTIFLQLRIFDFNVNDQEIMDICTQFLTEIISIITQCKFCLDHYEKTINNSNEADNEKAFLNASKTLLMGSVKTYWDKSSEKFSQIDKLSKKYVIES